MRSKTLRAALRVLICLHRLRSANSSVMCTRRVILYAAFMREISSLVNLALAYGIIQYSPVRQLLEMWPPAGNPCDTELAL
ncbi:hypothetical protein BC834DRAFT_900390 [Gloeopeniophorella convolvens]|nr:hypothetical protein BC834DRAFT_900390 [Gloeopeniophorella convolvens]